ncbi:MAG TPA: hypothetical protein VG052_16620 [Puia sp.]|nr:hypothetical protein [Puia sp.]
MKIVDVIPLAMSGESRQDVGASIAVNPNNPNEIVIAALTADPNGGPNAPVFVSTDGGDTWLAKNIVPGDGPTGTYGITVKYGRTSNELYAGIVKGNAPDQLAILRTINPVAAAVMAQMDSGGDVEQPYVAVGTVPGGPDAGKDRLYVGLNDLNATSQWGPALTSSIRQTMDALSPAPVFNSILLDRRPKTPGALQDLTPPRNGPQVRPAVHKDGTVYAVFYSWKTWADTGQGPALVTTDVVVVRDDNWGQSADPYGSLLDSGDGVAGQRVAMNVPLLFDGTLGFEQIGGDLSIAVDPTNSSILYVAWTEWQQGSSGNQTVIWLQVRRSADRGQTWSNTGLTAVRNARSPGLAINDKGQVGLIYQQLTGSGNNQRWETHLAFSQDAVQWSDTVLATVIATNYTPFYNFIGDYTNIMAVGNIFYGVFCTFNNPASKYFPQGVKFQRNHNYIGLFGVDNLTPVAPSIDPFFFETAFIPPAVKIPEQNVLGIVVIILFGIIGDGGGAYIDGSGHIHIIGPGDPGPVWEYLVSLAEYRLAAALNTRAGLEMQKLALQNVANLANAQIAQINGQLGEATSE